MADNILIRIWNINFLTGTINSIARMMNWIQFIFMCHLLSQFLQMWNSINSILWRGISSSLVSQWIDLLFVSKNKVMFPALPSILLWHFLSSPEAQNLLQRKQSNADREMVTVEEDVLATVRDSNPRIQVSYSVYRRLKVVSTWKPMLCEQLERSWWKSSKAIF